ncbi:MAG: MbcA/ParS/Xre antitoxin family protein [Candidatus Eremiobacteraeota bacterium]|nr:MbcA/ParS/Xre antitoxin family protein [Candidatus Eremiobacteraeota bacterium]
MSPARTKPSGDAGSRSGETAKERAARLGPAGIRGFFNIARLWHLSQHEQQTLLALPRSTLAKYRHDAASAQLGPDTLERISYLLGIYKALQILIPDTAQADDWVRRSNTAPLFGGRSALDRMLGGHVSDLYVVRQYLDAQRGW